MRSANDLPDVVYLVTADAQWPVHAIANDHPSAAAAVAREVERRTSPEAGTVRVWRARLVDVIEIELVPAAMTPPQLREKSS